MLFTVLVCCIISQALAATTHAPHVTHPHRTHATHEPVEFETYRYDPHTHIMAVMRHHTCYFYTMTTQESMDVHTSTGLHALETKINKMIDDTTATYATMSHHDVQTASKALAAQCNHNGWTTYKLN